MNAITLRPSAAHLATSRAVIVCAVFVVGLLPVLAGLLFSASRQTDELWARLYAVAALAPATGVVIALISVVVVLWRRSRPVLRIDGCVTIPHTGVSFPLEELHTVQLWSRGRTFVTLLPGHVDERVPHDRKAVAAYTVAFPAGATPRPFELISLIKEVKPGVKVDKIGSLT
ncbi:hypothetical protein [Corynebacterium halotolerans]|uniref:Or membrane protein n=1 Tax=Corynebacterium halotolerans YIM 70093 = DSM 44683 TaxID=1121362 RepID=M1P8W3_9CORY|nr:hypothetical protein [Corynebacterium halotolerans]AGF73111.1 hypothetical protein A605_10555 [Corynebacterium halotolerans YIM 70093 = DSM 44683]